MFKDLEEFKEFMVFCHTHYEINDIWHFKNGDKGILFEGWHDSSWGNQKYSPSKLNEDDRPLHKKRTELEEVYNTWQNIKSNLKN